MAADATTKADINHILLTKSKQIRRRALQEIWPNLKRFRLPKLDGASPTIYEYTDCVAFLRDFYKAKRRTNPKFSYAVFARRAGIRSRSYLHNILKGAKGITRSNAVSLGHAMGLSKKQIDYFDAMVGFKQAESAEEKAYFYDKINDVRHALLAKNPVRLREDQMEFYSKPYHTAVRLLIQMFGVKDEPKYYAWLASNVRPRITRSQVRASVRLLERLGFIEKLKDRRWHASQSMLITPAEIKSLALAKCHMEYAKLAIEAIRNRIKAELDISGLSLGISENTYHEFRERIAEFRRALLLEAERRNDADRVYRLNFHFYPLSETHIQPIR